MCGHLVKLDHQGFAELKLVRHGFTEPARPLVRHQVLQQEASRHLTCTSSGFTGQLYVVQCVNTRTGLRSRCETVTDTRRPTTFHSQIVRPEMTQVRRLHLSGEGRCMGVTYEFFDYFLTNGRHLLGLPPRISHHQRKIASSVRTENKIYRVNRWVHEHGERNFVRLCGTNSVSSRGLPIRACQRMMN